MNTDSKNPSSPQSDVSPTSRLFDDWIDPIETGVRARVRDWIEALVHSELDTALQRPLTPDYTDMIYAATPQDIADRRKASAMLFWALLASGQIVMRKIDGWTRCPPSVRISNSLTLPHDPIT